MTSKYLLVIRGSVGSAVSPTMPLLLPIVMLLIQTTAGKNIGHLLKLQLAGFEVGARLIEPFGLRAEFVAHNLFHRRARTAPRKHVIAAVDDMHADTPSESFDGRSGLQIQQVYPGFAARKHEN